MASRKLTATLVIRALNEAEHIGTLLADVERQSIRPDETIVVDSGSTDATVAIAASYGARIVHIASEDFSFGRALNTGCREATGDVLVFASAHVYPVDEHWLEALVAPFADDDVALVYGRQTGDHRSHFSELEVMRRWFPDHSDANQRHPFCNNANCAVRRSVWEVLPYNESLTGLEDVEWAKRALAGGHRLVYRADAAIVHVHTETFRSIANRYEREAIAYGKFMENQRMGAPEAFGLFCANVLRDYLASVPRRKVLRNLWAIPRFRAAQFLGSYRGFKYRGTVSGTLKRRFYYPKGFTAFERRGEVEPRDSSPR